MLEWPVSRRRAPPGPGMYRVGDKGVVVKPLDAPYLPGRRVRSWLKSRPGRQITLLADRRSLGPQPRVPGGDLAALDRVANGVQSHTRTTLAVPAENWPGCSRTSAKSRSSL